MGIAAENKGMNHTTQLSSKGRMLLFSIMFCACDTNESVDAGALSEPHDAGVEESRDGGIDGGVDQGETLTGPWDGVAFVLNSSQECTDPTGTRTAFPALLPNGDWDIEKLEEIPVDHISELTDTALLAGDHGPVECAIDYLRYFADNDAFYLEGDCVENGETALHDYERSLFTSGMVGLPLLKVRNDPLISSDDWNVILPWVRKLMTCHQVMLKDRLGENYINDFGGYHNSVYNVSLAGLSMAIVLDDLDAYQEFLDGYIQALENLNEDGTSPYELHEKGAETFFYHNYISNYASHVALLADLNGSQLLNHEKLANMRALVLDQLEGGSVFEDIAETEQLRDPRDEPWNLTWTYHIGRINDDGEAKSIADEYDWMLTHAMTSGTPETWWVEGASLRAQYGDL
jgi:hypothetical protein